MNKPFEDHVVKHYDHSMLMEEEHKEDLRKERKLYERD